jgi:hypothetical protein
MREVNVTPLSEVHVVEDEDHAGHCHANRGESMGGEGPEHTLCYVGGTCQGRRGNDVLDVEAWDESCEYGINSPILCYKVIRLRREGEMLGLLKLDVQGDVI